MGDVVAAVDRYQDIPAATRAKLKARMKARRYDDVAVIERDAIRGQANYAPEIRDMHFGPGAICRTVTRTRWAAKTQERGLVYCEDGQCVLVPTVCRNVSRIRRLDTRPGAVAPSSAANMASSTREADNNTPLEFEAPAAGPMASAPPESFAQGAGVPSLAETPSQPAASSLATLGSPPAQTTATGGGGSSFPTLVGTGMPALPPAVAVVPEPQTWAMAALGLLVVACRARGARRLRQPR